MDKLLSLTALLLSTQALMVVMRLFAFAAPLSQLACFGLWLVFFIIGQVIAAMLEDKKITGIKDYVTTEAVLTFLLLSTMVQMIFYDYRGVMANRTFNGLLVVAVLNKWFWPQIYEAGKKAYAFIIAGKNEKQLRWWLIGIGSLFLAAIIFVPHYERVLARMYIGEQFHHVDIFIMAAGWAAYNGHIMDVDQISQYGVGMPYIFAQLCRWMGGFSHAHVFLIIMTSTIIYYLLAFWFSLRWFKSALLALAVMLCTIRVQMFHPGDYPFIFTYPSATVIRYFFDLFVLAGIYLHLQQGDKRFLWGAGALSGFSVFYMDSTGIFLLMAFYSYLACLLLMPYTRSILYKKPYDLIYLATYLVLPLLTAFAFFYAIVGQHLFTSIFWHNFSETVEYFLSGIGTYPIYENFKYHNFFAGLMGLALPLVWVFTIIYVGAMCYKKLLSRRNIFVIVICIYGLGLNHYYIAHAVLTSYYVTALPFVFVCGWWAKLILWDWPQRRRFNALLALTALSVHALVSNHDFMAYPNIFNWSANPMVDFLTAQPLPADLSSYFHHLDRNDPEESKLPTNSLGSTDEQLYTENDFKTDGELTDYYKQDFDFSHDASMIDTLIPQGQPAAVISSFEIKILMQANRPPFFYYFPLISSHSKHIRSMPSNFLHTSRERFNAKAIDQLQAANPQYVFLEKIFLYNYPQAYVDKPENIIPIVDYVKSHYTPWQMGEYVVVMKHK